MPAERMSAMSRSSQTEISSSLSAPRTADTTDSERSRLVGSSDAFTDAERSPLAPTPAETMAEETTPDVSVPSASRRAAAKPKKRTVGRWYVCETIGKGGYSWVKRGEDKKTGKMVALKFMDKRSISRGCDKARFLRQMRQVKTEVESLKFLKHPNIVRLLAYNLQTKYPNTDGTHRPVVLLVLEYMAGGELFDLLYYTSKLDERMARTYFRMLISALKACHSLGIVHRDIKPQNLLLDKRFKLKLTDFGLSKLIESDVATMSTFSVGTKGYQSPEVLLEKAYSKKCDVFAAGVVLFVLVTGYPPFENASVSDPWYSSFVAGKYRRFWKLHKGCGVTLECADLITKMLLFNESERASVAVIERTPWFQDEVVDSETLQKVITLKHRQMQLKRSVDPVKLGIMHGSAKTPKPPKKPTVRDLTPILSPPIWSPIWSDDEEQDYDPEYLPEGGGRELSSIEAPPLPVHMGVSMVDIYTTTAPRDVLNFIYSQVNNDLGTAQINYRKLRGVLTFLLRGTEEMPALRAGTRMTVDTARHVQVEVLLFRLPEMECNLVKFQRRSGTLKGYMGALDRIRRDCGRVLTGLPTHKKEELALTVDEKHLIESYYRTM